MRKPVFSKLFNVMFMDFFGCLFLIEGGWGGANNVKADLHKEEKKKT